VSRASPATPITVYQGLAGNGRKRLPSAATPVESFQNNRAVLRETMASPSRCASMRSNGLPARIGIRIARK
jgi:hypothetical protein